MRQYTLRYLRVRGKLPNGRADQFYGDVRPYTHQLRGLDAFVGTHGSDANARFLLGTLYTIGGYRDEAAKELQAAARLSPNNRYATRMLARYAGGDGGSGFARSKLPESADLRGPAIPGSTSAQRGGAEQWNKGRQPEGRSPSSQNPSNGEEERSQRQQANPRQGAEQGQQGRQPQGGQQPGQRPGVQHQPPHPQPQGGDQPHGGTSNQGPNQEDETPGRK